MAACTAGTMCGCMRSAGFRRAKAWTPAKVRRAAHGSPVGGGGCATAASRPAPPWWGGGHWVMGDCGGHPIMKWGCPGGGGLGVATKQAAAVAEAVACLRPAAPADPSPPPDRAPTVTASPLLPTTAAHEAHSHTGAEPLSTAACTSPLFDRSGGAPAPPSLHPCSVPRMP